LDFKIVRNINPIVKYFNAEKAESLLFTGFGFFVLYATLTNRQCNYEQTKKTLIRIHHSGDWLL